MFDVRDRNQFRALCFPESTSHRFLGGRSKGNVPKLAQARYFTGSWKCEGFIQGIQLNGAILVLAFLTHARPWHFERALFCKIIKIYHFGMAIFFCPYVVEDFLDNKSVFLSTKRLTVSSAHIKKHHLFLLLDYIPLSPNGNQ